MVFYPDHVFTADEIQGLAVGDVLANCFGNPEPITSINCREQDSEGRWFAIVYQQFGETSEMSNTISEGSPIPSVC